MMNQQWWEIEGDGWMKTWGLGFCVAGFGIDGEEDGANDVTGKEWDGYNMPIDRGIVQL